MKINILMLFICFQVSATPLLSQQLNLTLNLKNTTVQGVIENIRSNTGYEFSYDSDILSYKLGEISVDVKNGKIEDVLQQIFSTTGIGYKIKGNRILLYEKADNARPVAGVKNEAKVKVVGTVKDNITGETLVGVTIQIKDKPQGTSTDINGNFVLDVPQGTVLVFTYVGYKKMEVPVTGATMNVVLEQNNEALEEVMIVGYGVQKKISMIGSQSTIEAKDLKVPVRNLTNSLAGRVSGLVSVQTKGEPGFDDASIYIRGISTFSSTMSKPLTLVDGVPRSFADVDPEDIESFSILKDASATAVYGVRGANGVILITTKTGKAGKPKFNARYTEGITTFTKLPSLADGVTYMKMLNEANQTRGGNTIYSDDAIEMTRTGADPYLYPNVNWFDEIYNKTGHTRNVNMNINGGSDKSIYYVGLGYYDELGLYKTDELANYNSSVYYKRYNVTSNLTLNPTNTTTVKLGIQGYLANANYPTTGSGDIFKSAYEITPVSNPVKYPDGKIADVRIGGGANPYALLTQTGYANQWRSQVFSNLKVQQELPFVTKGLAVSAMFSFDAYNYTSNRNTKTPDTWIATGRDEDGNLVFQQTGIGTEFLKYSKNSNGSRTIYGEAALNYARSFGRHDVSAMLLYNQSDEVNTQASELIESLPYRFRGLAGRSTYAFDNRYFVEFNFGYNGSENFLPEKRYGFFPSVGLGWVLSSEKFFEPVSDIIQFAKIRATHGIVGNSNIDGRRFAYIATVDENSGSYSFGKDAANGFTGKAIDEYAVDVSWETSTKTNVGIDLTTLNNKLNVQFDLFREHREGIFLRRASIPAYVGILKAPYGNVGVIDNKGFDASLNYSESFGDFFVQLMGNFSFNRNKVVEDDSPAWQYPWLERRGRRVGQRFGYVALGLFQSDEEVAVAASQTGDTRAGDIRYKDVNGDGVINSYDQVPIGYGATPEINYGFGFTVGYKSLSLSALFQGVGHVDAMLNGEGVMPFMQGSGRGNLFDNIGDRWTEADPRQDVFYPRLTVGKINDNYEVSSWWLKNTSYLRLKTVQLNYKLPQSFLSKIHIKSADVFFQGVNLLTFSSFKLWDVELGDGRGDRYPNIASYSLGLNISF